MAVQGMIQIGKPAPDFKCTAVVDGRLKEVSLTSYTEANHWIVLVFFPKAWSFICPTEIKAFSARLEEFLYTRSCAVMFASTDSEYCLKAWNATSDLEGGLGGVHIPLISDCNHALSRSYGVLIEETGVAQRALFIIDPKGIMRALSINDADVGRSVDEAQRVLDALKFKDEFGEGCPVDWKAGDKGINTTTPLEKLELKKSWSEWARPKLTRAWSGTSQRSIGSVMSGRSRAGTLNINTIYGGGGGGDGAVPPVSPHNASVERFLNISPHVAGSGKNSPLISPTSAARFDGQIDETVLAQRMENIEAAMRNQGIGVANIGVAN